MDNQSIYLLIFFGGIFIVLIWALSNKNRKAFFITLFALTTGIVLIVESINREANQDKFLGTGIFLVMLGVLNFFNTSVGKKIGYNLWNMLWRKERQKAKEIKNEEKKNYEIQNKLKEDLRLKQMKYDSHNGDYNSFSNPRRK